PTDPAADQGTGPDQGRAGPPRGGSRPGERGGEVYPGRDGRRQRVDPESQAEGGNRRQGDPGDGRCLAGNARRGGAGLEGEKVDPVLARQGGRARREPAPRLHRAADVRPDRVGPGNGGDAVPGEGATD